jgi:hypothetical protein
MLQLCDATALQMVANATKSVVGGNFTGTFAVSYILLFTATAKWTPDVALADITEADFAGYVRKAMTPLGTPYHSGDNRATQDFAAVNFQSTDNVKPNTIVGYAMVDALTLGNVQAIERLPAPIQMVAAGDGFTLVPRLELPPTADWGEAAVAS